MEIKHIFTGLPVHCSRGYLGWSAVVLVRTARFRLLFDTAGYNERPFLQERLAAEGLRPGDIDMVVLSHLHYDHALNYTLFPRAKIVVGKLELEYAASAGGSESLLIPEGIAERLAGCPNLHPVNDGDRIADNLTIYHTPGHTPGSISLLAHGHVRTLLLGDAVKSGREFIYGAKDAGETWHSSAEKVRELGELFIPGHDRPFRASGDRSIVYEGSAGVDIYTHFYPDRSTRGIFSIRIEDHD